MTEYTLGMIKPDAVEKNVIGKILSRFEENNLNIVALKKTKLSVEQAQKFYAVHRERPFYNDLVTLMTSGPVIAYVLKGENAVAKNREIMGATNPANAAEGTIRKDFATDIEKNAVHGSDSIENAQIESRFFFSELEMIDA